MTVADDTLRFSHPADRDRLAELGTLASGLVHELKNPLGVIMLNAELLQQQLAGLPVDAATRERMQKRLERIVSSSRNLQVVADSFLGFARPQRPDPEAVDINALLEDVVAEQEELTERDAITVTLHLDPLLPQVPADRQQLRAIFSNIVKNAREALRERPQERKMLIITRAGPTLARVMIHNNGPPIPEPVLGRLFQPFVSGKDDGTGLGLAIVRRLVDLHHGRVEVSSDPQQGVSFALEFPTSLGPALPHPELPLPEAEAVVREDTDAAAPTPVRDATHTQSSRQRRWRERTAPPSAP